MKAEMPLFTIKACMESGEEVISCRHQFDGVHVEPAIASAWKEGIAYISGEKVLWANPRRIRDIEIIPYSAQHYRSI